MSGGNTNKTSSGTPIKCSDFLHLRPGLALIRKLSRPEDSGLKELRNFAVNLSRGIPEAPHCPEVLQRFL
jgi:hypothetical protein